MSSRQSRLNFEGCRRGPSRGRASCPRSGSPGIQDCIEPAKQEQGGKGNLAVRARRDRSFAACSSNDYPQASPCDDFIRACRANRWASPPATLRLLRSIFAGPTTRSPGEQPGIPFDQRARARMGTSRFPARMWVATRRDCSHPGTRRSPLKRPTSCVHSRSLPDVMLCDVEVTVGYCMVACECRARLGGELPLLLPAARCPLPAACDG